MKRKVLLLSIDDLNIPVRVKNILKEADVQWGQIFAFCIVVDIVKRINK